MTHDFYRPAYVALCKAGFDAAGALVAWQTTSAGSSLGAPSFMDNSTDGAWNTAYDFPQARVAHVPVESAVTTGIWRSVAHSQNGFFVESFIDECAVAAGKDPVAFRAGLLAKDARHLAVLKRVAELSSGASRWPTDPTARSARAAWPSTGPSAASWRRWPRCR